MGCRSEPLKTGLPHTSEAFRMALPSSRHSAISITSRRAAPGSSSCPSALSPGQADRAGPSAWSPALSNSDVRPVASYGIRRPVPRPGSGEAVLEAGAVEAIERRLLTSPNAIQMGAAIHDALFAAPVGCRVADAHRLAGWRCPHHIFTGSMHSAGGDQPFSDGSVPLRPRASSFSRRETSSERSRVTTP